jgi:hypothetical protein
MLRPISCAARASSFWPDADLNAERCSSCLTNVTFRPRQVNFASLSMGPIQGIELIELAAARELAAPPFPER